MIANWLTTTSKLWSANGSAERIALTPIDLRADAARHREHALIAIEPGDLLGQFDPISCRTRKHAGPAADVEHAVTSVYTCRLSDLLCPLADERGNKEPLINFGRIVGDLEVGRFRHDALRGEFFGLP